MDENMSLLKKLQIGDNHIGRYTKEYLLNDYKCHTFRKHNEYRPTSDRMCDGIELTVIAPGKNDMQLYQSFIEQSTFSGRILIELPPKHSQNGNDMKEIQFEEALCYSLEEDYHIGDNQRRVLKLLLVAESIVIDGVKFNRAE